MSQVVINTLHPNHKRCTPQELFHNRRHTPVSLMQSTRSSKCLIRSKVMNRGTQDLRWSNRTCHPPSNPTLSRGFRLVFLISREGTIRMRGASQVGVPLTAARSDLQGSDERELSVEKYKPLDATRHRHKACVCTRPRGNSLVLAIDSRHHQTDISISS